MGVNTSLRLVGLMACTRHGGVIGRGGKIPWRIPAEFAHFKRTTDGGVVVLGYSLSLCRRLVERVATPLPLKSKRDGSAVRLPFRVGKKAAAGTVSANQEDVVLFVNSKRHQKKAHVLLVRRQGLGSQTRPSLLWSFGRPKERCLSRLRRRGNPKCYNPGTLRVYNPGTLRVCCRRHVWLSERKHLAGGALMRK